MSKFPVLPKPREPRRPQQSEADVYSQYAEQKAMHHRKRVARREAKKAHKRRREEW